MGFDDFRLLRCTCPSRLGAVAAGLCLAIAAAVTPCLYAQETVLPPKQRAERLTLDEKTGTWISTPAPAPGTAEGDLAIVRQLLARQDYKEALKAAKTWIKTYGTESDLYPAALYLRGTAYMETGDFRGAHEDFQAILNEYAGSEYAEDALQGDFRVAEQYIAGKRRKAWGGLLWIKDRDGGVKILDDVVLNYPDTPLAELAQRAKADYYYARGEFELAEDEYAAFARDFPRSRFHPYALLQSARAALASFPGVKFDDAGLVEAQERFTQFQSAYPAAAEELDVPVLLDEISARRAEKTLEIGKFYQKTKHHTAAAYYYRQTVKRWPETPAAAEAAGRLAGLGVPLQNPELTAARRPGDALERGG